MHVLRFSSGAPLWLLLVVNALLLTGVCWRFVPAEALEELRSASWIVSVWLSYPWLFLLPVYLVAALAGRFVAACLRRPDAAPLASLVFASLLFSVVQLGVAADQRVLDLYGFHLNGFVWNLLTTRGGIAALGAGPETYRALALLAAAALLLQGVAAFAAARAARSTRFAARLGSRAVVVPLLLGLLALTGYERLAFGASRVDGYRRVLEAEEAFPFYQRTSVNSLAKRLGFQVAQAGPSAELRGKGLAYPLRPIVFRAEAKRLNVIVLCAESLRADALGPEQMPATWARAQHGLRFERHLSAGNGTRMGVFGLFYGLPGPYWFRFLNAQRGPVLLSSLQQRGYDVRGFTADDFSYPEFDQTVFAELDRAQLREFGGKTPSWQRDRKMVGEIVDYLGQRDPARPFFLYAFFESPHARYDFPDETALYRPYLESFDYVTMNLERDIEKIHNRYRNSVRHLDTQYERVLAELEARGLLDSTIVVITGDHGEEFMEQGRWGHNSAFSEAQIRVPLVLLAPGLGAGVVDRLSSHLDIPATLLSLLGVESAASDYSLGRSLLHDPARRYALVSDWRTVTFVDGEGKVEFPMRAASFLKRPVRDRKDGPLADPAAFLNVRASLFAEVLGDMSRLSARR